MARYKVMHETSYSYSIPVLMSQHQCHLLPRPCDRQNWISHEMQISPQPVHSEERTDLFGNTVLSFCLETEHRDFSVIANGIVEVGNQQPTDCPTTCAQAVLRLKQPTCDDDWEASFHAYASERVNIDSAITDYASQSLSPDRPLAEAAQELMTRIFNDFTYAPATTTINTMPTELLRERHGVCQDFAHFYCACLRSHGLASRYVSGYLLTHSPEGQPKLIGVDATHAWNSVYLPDFGWLELDPTNGIVVGDGHIVVAWGRDFSDVSPLKGVITGGGPHTVKVGVHVEPDLS